MFDLEVGYMLRDAVPGWAELLERVTREAGRDAWGRAWGVMVDSAGRRGGFTPQDYASLVEILGTESLADDFLEMQLRLHERLAAETTAQGFIELLEGAAVVLDADVEIPKAMRGCTSQLHCLENFITSHVVRIPPRHSLPRAARRVRARRRSVRTSPRAANAPPSTKEDDPPGEARLDAEPRRRRGDLVHVSEHLTPALRRLFGGEM